MWDLIVSVPDHCLSFTSQQINVLKQIGKSLNLSCFYHVNF